MAPTPLPRVLVAMLVLVSAAAATTDSSLWLDSDGDLYINSDANKSVLLNGVDVAALAARIEDLERRLFTTTTTTSTTTTTTSTTSTTTTSTITSTTLPPPALTFTTAQTIPTRGGGNVVFFNTSAQAYLVFGRDDGSNNIGAVVYRRSNSGSATFALVQTLDTQSASDCAAFAAGGEQFLVCACYRISLVKVLRLNSGGQFDSFQDLSVTGASAVSVFTFNSDTFLAVSSAYDFNGHYDLLSPLMRRNPTTGLFSTFQSIPTRCATKMAFFVINGTLHLAHGNFFDGTSTVYSNTSKVGVGVGVYVCV